MKALALILTLSLTGCGSLVSTDQLNAASASKNRMAALCVNGNPSVMGGVSRLVYATVDADVVKSGTVSVDDQCKMSFTNNAAVSAAIPVVVAPAK